MFKFFLYFSLITTIFGTSYRNNDASRRIMQGVESPQGMFPYLASIILYNDLVCGGSIIGRYWVLTAAHCVYDEEAESIIEDKFLAIAVGNIFYKLGERYPVHSKIVHEGFNFNEPINDITLIRVSVPFKFSQTVRPINLDPYPIDDYSTPVHGVVAGWGISEENVKELNPRPTPNLRYANVNTIPLNYCRTLYKMAKETFRPMETNICVFTMVGRGTCTGDSGGPLVIDNRQVGVLSSGGSCDNSIPEVYTRISSYYTWIKKALGEMDDDCDYIEVLMD